VQVSEARAVVAFLSVFPTICGNGGALTWSCSGDGGSGTTGDDALTSGGRCRGSGAAAHAASSGSSSSQWRLRKSG